jgi:ArsR family transcriptional regulator, arsenate/arsenite/antimonite-responsive transcriptional repressor
MVVDLSIEEKQARFLKCISEPTRLRIIKLLSDGEKCVNDIVNATGRDQPLVSHHLKALKACGIVVSEQRAQKIFYDLADSRIAALVLASEKLLNDVPLCREGSGCCE